MEVEAFCGVHDMIHAAIISNGSQASLREVTGLMISPLATVSCKLPANQLSYMLPMQPFSAKGLSRLSAFLDVSNQDVL